MDTINIRIFDKNINFLGEVDNYTSLFYIRKWNTYGEFEFHVSKMNTDLFKRGNIIMLGNDGYRTGTIEYIEDNEEDNKDIIIKGFSLLYYLSQRITVPPVNVAYDTYNTNIENIMLGLVNINSINPIDPNRKIPLLTLNTSLNRGDKLSFQTRYKNLEEELYKLSNHSGLGADIKLDYKTRKLIFEVLEGRNLSYFQSVNSPVIFSKKYDNITKRNYIESYVGYKNVGYVAGQGEGSNRELVIINNTNSGLDRRETFIDARDISEGENISLEDRGKVKLAENIQIQSFECNVDTKKYKKDWDLGDIVTVKDEELNITNDYRVIEVKEIYENNGFKVETVFGTSIPTLIDKIKQSNDTPIAEGGGSGEPGTPGTDGENGVGLNYNWNGTSLGVKREDETSYKYTNLLGPQGLQGERGPQGLQGPKGDTGAKGDQGVQGPKGDKGDTGTTGPQGIQGIQGLKGDQGIQGNQGVIGPVGPRFTPSVDSSGNLSWTNNGGLTNPTTVNIKGPQGIQGIQGIQGPKGDTGAQGPQGAGTTITTSSTRPTGQVSGRVWVQLI